MTATQDTAGLVERLRNAAQHSQQRVLGSRIFGEAADAIEAQARALTAKDSELAEARAALADPVSVHRNMLAGTIAKPSPMNIAHLYPEVQGLRQALIATLKHFRHPTSAEHETRDKVMAALSHFDDPPLTPYFGARSVLPQKEADSNE